MKSIKVVSIIASMPGLERVLQQCPGLEVFVGAADSGLDKRGFIVPGVGDAGDRLYNTGSS